MITAQDLEAPGSLERALGPPRGRDEPVVLLVTDQYGLRFAHNLMLNAQEVGLTHHLVVGSDEAVCRELAMRSATGACGHSTFLQRKSSTEVDRALREWTIADSSPHHLLWQR